MSEKDQIIKFGLDKSKAQAHFCISSSIAGLSLVMPPAECKPLPMDVHGMGK